MRRQPVESYIAYPALIPFPLIQFIGGAFKWFIILTCVASVPYSLYRCSSVISQVAHNPKPVHNAAQHRRHTPFTPKGPRT